MKIAIVNDSIIEIEALRRVICTVSEYQVVWVARDGVAAVEQCVQQPPDLILMNLIMPLMDGVEATRRIMQQSPCAILLVTSGVSEQAGRVFEAMGYGALDVVDTPSLGLQGSTDTTLLNKIATIGKLIGHHHPIGDRAGRNRPMPLLAIGASTGGPKALATILAQFPADLSAAVVVVQHVDAQFASGLADWLASQCSLPVKVAGVGDRLAGNCITLAGTNDHLILTGNQTWSYTPDPRESAYRPSIDIFFHSLVKHWKNKGVAMLLTGMGKDGAEGLLALKRAGWYTIAQDEATSIVYGMPKAAAELGAASEILPVEAIAGVCLRQLAALS